MNMTPRPSRRMGEDHYHPDSWTKSEQHRFEDRVSDELRKVRADLEKLTIRLTYLLGGLAFLAFLLPLVAPLMRTVLGIPNPE
jgi:hypothetical protein